MRAIPGLEDSSTIRGTECAEQDRGCMCYLDQLLCSLLMEGMRASADSLP